MPGSLVPHIRAASEAAIAAGALLVRHLGRPRTVETKRSATDLVTELDRASEALIHRRLTRAFPGFGFLGEEQGERTGASEYRWIVDPLDGTNNFVHGLPLFGVSIGLERLGRIVAGVIYDPNRRELFTAARGGGAYLNGRRIRVSKAAVLAKGLLSTGFSSRFTRSPAAYLRWFKAFQARSHGVRRLGSTVLCLAWIASGRLEGFYERDLWPWDIAAGLVLVEEAGGQVSDFDGGQVGLNDGRLVASNGRIHRAILRGLNAKQ